MIQDDFMNMAFADRDDLPGDAGKPMVVPIGPLLRQLRAPFELMHVRLHLPDFRPAA